MSTTTERKISVASGLGDADASQVMAGSTFSSESGFSQNGTFEPSASNITYNNATSGLGSTNTQGAIDEIVTLTNESGHSIDVTLNKSTYVMTISLKDKNGEVLNEKTVDFPMETAFVNASYDKSSKTMKFTLESGSTVDVPLGDLVEGLVSQTDFDVLRGEVESNTNAISVINSNLDVNVMIGKYPDTNTIQNVTFTKISDGKYKVVGTNSATYGALCRCSVFTALANVEYKVNVSGDSSNCRIGADNISESVWIGIKPNGSTFKFDSDTIVSVYIEVIGGATVDSTIEFSVTTKNVGVEVSNINSEVIDLKMLGWTVPRECPIQNSVSSNIFTQRVGRVDLGILNWSKDSNSGHERFVTTTLKGTINPNTTDNNGLFKGFCTKYTIDNANGTYLHSSDKTIASDNDGNIWVYDSSYNDKNADDFKNSLKGVYLYYELANPITMTIDGNEAVEVINNKTNKNLLPVEDFSITQDGITFIGNSKTGEISVSGTCTSDWNMGVAKTIRLKAGRYIVSGSVGGSNSTYGIVIQYDGNTILQTNDEVTIELTKTTDVKFLYAWACYNASVNTIIKPMVRVYGDNSSYEVGVYNNETLTDKVDNIDISMSDYRLNNVFDGILKQGHYNSLGEWYDDDYFVTTSNAISCNANDLITVKYENPFEIDVRFFDANNNYIDANLYDTQVSEYQCTAPSGAKKFYVGIGYSYTEGKLTPKNARHLGVYINNQIDVMKNDIDTINSKVYTYKTWIGDGETVEVPCSDWSIVTVIGNNSAFYALCYVGNTDYVKPISNNSISVSNHVDGKVTITNSTGYGMPIAIKVERIV